MESKIELKLSQLEQEILIKLYNNSIKHDGKGFILDEINCPTAYLNGTCILLYEKGMVTLQNKTPFDGVLTTNGIDTATQIQALKRQTQDILFLREYSKNSIDKINCNFILEFWNNLSKLQDYDELNSKIDPEVQHILKTRICELKDMTNVVKAMIDNI